MSDLRYTDSTTIARMQVKGVGLDSGATRLRLASLLSSADLRPTGVPPSAVLIVRRMADPLPSRVAPKRPTVRVDAAWERAAQNALADVYRHAARPSRGPVPANAEAILF